MQKVDTANAKLIRAAGGLLWRKIDGAWQIAIVHRQRYGDWSLPKGKLKKSETWHQAALREVMEETGYAASLRGFAGAVAYPTSQGPKVVRFWHMVAGDVVTGVNDEEVDVVDWLSRDEALARLQYPLEMALLETWSGADIYAEPDAS